MKRWYLGLGAALLVGCLAGVTLRGGTVVYVGRGDMVLQSSSNNCGPAALAYVMRELGGTASQKDVAAAAGTNDGGTSMLGLAIAAETFGLHATGLTLSYDGLLSVPLPAVAVFKNHFVVLTRVTPHEATVGDPLYGFFRYGRRAFLRVWQGELLVVERR